MYTDLNDLCLASYNELIRLKLIPNKERNLLTPDEIQNINEIIYNKLGDTLLNEILEYKNGKITTVNYKFNNIGTFTQLVLLFALCYVNYFNMNDYFNLEIKE